MLTVGDAGVMLAERMWRAVVEGREQAAIHTEFTEAVEEENGSLLKRWRERVAQFELEPKKKKKKNPYDVEDGRKKSKCSARRSVSAC